jgi:hypothetical protein
MNLVYYLPLVTFALSILFSIQLFRHWRTKREATYLLWWMIGVLTYGAGTFTESFNTLHGWTEPNFRMWYITGALLGGAPLAQGTVYLLMPKRLAHLLSALLVTLIITASVCVMLSPIDYSLVDAKRMSGAVFEWQWVRSFSPFINIYALAFLAGGAIYSAIIYYDKTGTSNRFWGNTLIAVGAILPAIGGSATRFGYVEALYVTELIGLVMIYIAYLIMRKDKAVSVHKEQEILVNR